MAAPVAFEIRLALVDDHELFRTALGRSLRDYGFQVVAEGEDARELFPLIDRLQPDIVLMDLNMPSMDGMTALRELRARSRELRVVVLTSSTEARDINDAWAAGASGYATKAIGMERLVGGLREVIGGGRFLQPGLPTPEAKQSEGPLGLLSVRERDVFRMLVRGLTSADIAKQLCISIKTVRTHRDRILGKLGCHSAVQLVRFAVANHLLT